jgi:thioredoxin-related protein
MKRLGLLISAAVIIFLSACSSSENTQGRTVKWLNYSDGTVLAKQDGKKIFLNFHADWCAYCKKMDKVTFRNKAVLDYLDENFVSISVDADKEKELVKKFGVSGLPSNWFIETNGEPVTYLPGYLGPEQLLSILKYINTDSYKSMRYQEFVAQKAGE